MKKNTTKRALFSSIVSMLVCVSMLLGSTFAWFTDSVTVANNQIVAGNLDIELYHSNRVDTDQKVESDTPLFDDVTLWEPGAVAYENLKITNEGTLALEYLLSISFNDFNTVVENGKSLKDILKIALVEDTVETTGDEEADRAAAIALGEDDFISITDFVFEGTLMAQDEVADNDEKELALIVYWEPSAEDNDFNVNNGKTTDDGEALSINLGISLFATQLNYETDSFGPDYDKDAEIVSPIELPDAATEDLTLLADPTERTVEFALGGANTTTVLPVALKFSAPDEVLTDKPYKDWNADFVVKFSKDVKANQVVFLGYHDAQGSWVPLPLTRDVEAGEEIRVMTELFAPAMEVILGASLNPPANAGLGYSWISSLFSPFTCGLISTTDFMAQNAALADKADFEQYITEGFTDMGFAGLDYTDTDDLPDGTKVTLELRMYATEEGETWDFGGIENGVSYVLDTFTYTLD